MKQSIRTRLFLGLACLVLSFVLLSLIFTFFGAEKYYIWQKKNVLISASQTIARAYNGQPEDISLELERMGNTIGAGIVIVSQEGYVKYSSFARIINQKPMDSPPPHRVPGPDKPRIPGLMKTTPSLWANRDIIDEHTMMEVQQDRNLKIDFLVLEHQLENQDSLIIRQPMAPIAESAAIAFQFVIFTGGIALIVGFLWAYIFSQRFTRPILEINQIAQNMSKLNFSQKCSLERQDELGELASSINQLSGHLDSAISELNEKNLQLMADVEKERQLDKMRKDFVSSVSHELKTPLSLILGYAEGLKENVAKDEDSRNFYCSVIIDEAEKMDKLASDLLNLSQIESGYFRLNKTEFDLSPLLDEVALKYQTVLADKEIDLQLIKANHLPVYGDRLRIEQIIFNLFNNAIDHTDAAKRIILKVQERESKLRVSLFNSGQPIPEESLEKLWLSFYKVDKARTRSHGGYGLGLSIVRAIQELHQNAYGVENTEGGVCFWFDLDWSDKGNFNSESVSMPPEA